MVTGPVPPPSEAPWVDQVPRMDRVLREHPGWGIRYDGSRDVFRAHRKVHGGTTQEIVRRELRDVLDELERQ